MESQTNQLTNFPVLHVILHRNYETVKSFCVWLAKNVSGYLVGEHPADEDIETTHCHILVEGLKVTTEAMRKEIQKVSGGRGQYVILSVTQKTRVKHDKDKLAVYILKGDEDTCQETSYNKLQIIAWARLWVAPVSAEKKEKTHWDVIMTARRECHKYESLNNMGALLSYVENSRENWLILINELNKAKIRTSRNELERIWCTLLRQDENHALDMYDSINSNMFRKNF